MHAGAIQVPYLNPATDQKQAMVGPTNMVIRTSGWLYVYLSNESNQNVYFDDLVINHKHGPVVQQTAYYPFGLEIPGLASHALSFGGNDDNRIKYQKQELQSNEFSDGSGLQTYEFKYRMDDPQIGRFWSVDPLADKYAYNSTYAFSENKVVNGIELEGLEYFGPTVNAGYIYDLTASKSQQLSHENIKEMQKGANKAAVDYTPVLITFSFGPEIAIPLGISFLTGAPTTSSPQAIGGAIAEDGTNLTKAELFEQNKANGAAYEQLASKELSAGGESNIQSQITIKTASGAKPRVDFISTGSDGKINLTEAKSSATAPLSKVQKIGYPSIAQSGGIIAGKGKPGYPGGTVIPPTNVRVMRPQPADAIRVKSIIVPPNIISNNNNK